MQGQLSSIHQDQITTTQSLSVVETLLRAGFGCITYCRGLLPPDNFGEGHLTSSTDGSMSSQSSSRSNSFAVGQRNNSSIKIKTVTRGFTEEADKLLNYLEFGIFDALQKQYLRSFILAIYLDSTDPNNIVEAYTFNFSYQTAPGSTVAVPVMSLGDDLLKMSLRDAPDFNKDIGIAATEGRPPTIGEVKKSVKTLIKTLISAMSSMEALPARRFATFKLFYYENTPADYEPPHFRPGDAERDKFFFTTHEKSEAPEKWSIGSMISPHHGVNVHITSIAGFLPSPDDNNATYAGLSNNTRSNQALPPSRTPIEDAAARMLDLKRQEMDASDRQIVWDAESAVVWSDTDAEGEDDPDFLPVVNDSGIDIPLGIRSYDGHVLPVECRMKSQHMEMDDDIQFSGDSETVPSNVGALVHLERDNVHSIEPTQSLQATQAIESTQPPSQRSEFIADDGAESSLLTNGVETQLLRDMRFNTTEESSLVDRCDDIEMLDMETQVISRVIRFGDDPIESFPSRDAPMAGRSLQGRLRVVPSEDHVLDCDCGVSLEDDDVCFCEGGCNRWYHLWCMGYHSALDNRIPDQFICFDCRLRRDQNFEFVVVRGLHHSMLSAFKDLALFRRAIKIAENQQPETVSQFTKLIGCEGAVANQLCKRLETEGFIAMEYTETDNLGLMESRTRTNKGKSKGRKAKPRKNSRKPKYIFIRSSKSGVLYQEYFNPTSKVEKKLLNLSSLVSKKGRGTGQVYPVTTIPEPLINNSVANIPSTISKYDSTFHGHGQSQSPTSTPQPIPTLLDGTHQLESQTQEETQIAPPPVQDLKRRTSSQYLRAKKRLKVSLGLAVDLGD